MASVMQILACGCSVVDAFPTSVKGSGLSSLSHSAGSSWIRLRNACEIFPQRGAIKPMPALILAAGGNQKKKTKAKKRSKTDLKQWKFDELMLVWDDVFGKTCENTTIASKVYELSQNGFSQHGRGCVLIQDSVITRPWGPASGFTFKSRYSSSDSPQLPSYASMQWKAHYVPKEFILDPFKAPETSDTPDALTSEDVVQVVDRENLRSVLRGMDKTRILGLLADPKSEELSDLAARDAGGEEPCDPDNDELVILLHLLVDGQPACGADVLKAFPTIVDGANGNTDTAGFWTLQLRNGFPLR